MPQSIHQLKQEQGKYLQKESLRSLLSRLRPAQVEKVPLQKKLPKTKEMVAEPGVLRNSLKEQGIHMPVTTGEEPLAYDGKAYAKNIENFLGLCALPVGIAGPLRVNGLNAKGDFLIPLATTEAALVASFHRGAKAITLSGGAASLCISERISRAPIFLFHNIENAVLFSNWFLDQEDNIKKAAESTTQHGKLLDISISVNGSEVVMIFDFYTGDAAGQNMVTIASDAICEWIAEKSPVPYKRWFIESNLSGDKKATVLSFIRTRGKKVIAEAILPKAVCQKVLKVEPGDIMEAWKVSVISTCQSGAIGSQSHFANGLTALYTATGQDIACISESSIGITQYELTPDGSLKINVSLPNLTVGTVGGGTKLPTQKECLKLLDCQGPGTARKFAEICGALVMAGELSITAAICSGDFTSAHKNLARG